MFGFQSLTFFSHPLKIPVENDQEEKARLPLPALILASKTPCYLLCCSYGKLGQRSGHHGYLVLRETTNRTFISILAKEEEEEKD